MKNSRRKFIKGGLAVGIGLPILGSSLISCNPKTNEAGKSNKKLKILILGGTSFLGPHQIAYAISRGHSVTTFTRGKSKPTVHLGLFDQVESLIGDREDNLSALENGQWDVVFDNSGRKVEWTTKTAELLRDRVNLYLYTSSTGVYYPYLGDDIGQDTELVLEEPSEGTNGSYSYGVMKANSELETIRIFGNDRSIVVRPTYMLGPGDKTDRFMYWPVRLAQGGEILVPGKPTDPVQYADVRDVAEWMVRLAEEGTTGTFNAIGPKNPETIHDFADQVDNSFDVETSFVKIDDYEFLKENRVEHLIPWIMPVDDYYGSARIRNQNAILSGLTFRPLKETIRDIHEWWSTVSQERRDGFEKQPNGLLVREESILEKWKARS
ncbi:MAG: NAD-dependent epimerase/dehydratase family protein [Cyclobacteriaceae bacterium]